MSIQRRDLIKGALTMPVLSTAPVYATSTRQESVRDTSVHDVIVIGAGLAGLHAATQLEGEGLDVRVLEGRTRVGGRVYTLYDIPGQPEAGGEVLGSYYARCLSVAESLGLEYEAPRPRSQASDADLMLSIRGQTILMRDWPGHQLNPHPERWRDRAPWQIFFQELPKLNPLPSLDSWSDSEYAKYDVSFWRALRDLGMSDEAIRLQEVNSAYGNTVFDVSMLHINHYFKWAELQAAGGARFAIKGGNGQLPEGMAAALRVPVTLDAPVVAIEQESNRVIVTTTHGQQYRARKVLVTVPFTLLRAIQMNPPLSGLQREAVATLPYYNTFQIHFEILRPYWEDDQLPPSIWSDAIFGRLNVLRERGSGRPACVVAYVNGLQSAHLDRLTPAAAAQLVMGEIERIRPATRGALRPIRVHSNQNDPFKGGSYAYWHPGQPTRLPGVMAQAHGQVHFAGEHTALVNRGMEGAMESADRAAFEILDSL